MVFICTFFKLHDLKIALGQYDIYISFLELLAPDYKLYVAISEKAYKNFFVREAIQIVINRHRTPLVVVNLERGEVVKWIN